jgi:hypothetical protein
MKKYMVINDRPLTPEEFLVWAEFPSWVEAKDDVDAARKVDQRLEYVRNEAARRLKIVSVAA